MNTEGLTEQKMGKRNGKQGSFFLDADGKCVGKTCGVCEQVLPASAFTVANKQKYGLKASCRECSKALTRAHRSKVVNGEAYSTASARTRSEKRRARTEEQIAAKRDELRPDGLKTCRGCKASLPFVAYYDDAIEADGLTAHCKVCRSAEKSANYKKKMIKDWTQRSIALNCYVCGTDWDHSDHVVPSTLGGPDGTENRLPMCEYHNISKNGTPLLQWLRERHPERVEEVMTRVFSYGMRPWTRLDVWTEVPVDHQPRIKISIKG